MFNKNPITGLLSSQIPMGEQTVTHTLTQLDTAAQQEHLLETNSKAF